MKRANHQGSVRNSIVEAARDQRMLALTEQGLGIQQIAEPMGLARGLVRQRIARARAVRDAGSDHNSDLERPMSSRDDAPR